MEEFRAIVLPDSVLLFIAQGTFAPVDCHWRLTRHAGGDSHLMRFKSRMASLAADHEHAHVPFELRAFECVLSLAAESLQRELDRMYPVVASTAKHAMAESSRVNLEVLRDVRNTASRLQLRASALHTALDNFLLDDRDMAMMQFSAILADPSRFEDGEPDEEWISHHDEVEMMAEAYLQQVDASISQLKILELELNTVESNVMLQLDTTRNRLLLVETSIMALTAACGIGAMVAGVFGMNLASGVNTAPNWVRHSLSLLCTDGRLRASSGAWRLPCWPLSLSLWPGLCCTWCAGAFW